MSLPRHWPHHSLWPSPSPQQRAEVNKIQINRFLHFLFPRVFQVEAEASHTHSSCLVKKDIKNFTPRRVTSLPHVSNECAQYGSHIQAPNTQAHKKAFAGFLTASPVKSPLPGVALRSGPALERLGGGVTAVVLDKTGTLTLGRPHVTAFRRVLTRDDAWLRRAAAAVGAMTSTSTPPVFLCD